jgi:hypothetical protein
VNPDQIALLRERLISGRQPVTRAEIHAHPRGWNDALDFVEKVLKEVLGENERPASD